MEKTITVLRIILLLILIAILSCVLALFVNKDLSFGFTSKAELVYDKNIEENIDNINIYSDSLNYKIIKSERNIANVKVYDDEENKVTVKVEDNSLKITSDNRKVCFFCSFKKREVIISLPEKEYDLYMETKSGDIKSSLDLNNVTIKSTSGDIKLDNTNDVNIKVTSGDINISRVDNLIIDSTSGDININKINKYVDINTTSGDINISDLTLEEDSKIKVTSGDININQSSNNIYFNAKTTSGSVRINNNDRFANIELMINTISGDIRVK